MYGECPARYSEPVTPPVVLTVGGSDSSGASGIQADLKTFAAFKAYGASVVTAVMARNTRTVADVYGLPGTVVSAQLGAVVEDLPIAVVKTGMFPNADTAAAVASRARQGALPNMVVDPVLLTSVGSRMAVTAAMERLLPYALVATPDREEASALLGWQVATPDDMATAVAQIAAGGPRYVVITGGDFATGTEALDVVWMDGVAKALHAPRIASRNTSGSGATFAAAIAARIALGDAPPEAILTAKGYVSRAIGDAVDWDLGTGTGPLDHFGWSSVSLA
jgi:hydroxymethylpyrimidine kinase/phosphomethylpyrimidine kinase